MNVDFGIYILTYPGDFHLSMPLIKSLRYFHPDVSIMIVPGDDFDRNNHPFDVPIMPEPQSDFWQGIRYQDRKFWVFQGPFERFLYLDADIICTHDLSSLIYRITNQAKPFVFAKIDREKDEWCDSIKNQNHAHHNWCVDWVDRGLGNPKLLVEFDNSYDPYGRMPFNSGIFASSRNTLEACNLEDLYNAEIKFYKTKLGKDFNWKSAELFYRDQGRLNYLVDKLGLPLINLHPDGNDVWSGDDCFAESITIEHLHKGTLPFSFIHWAGVPRPTPSLFFMKPWNIIHRISSDYSCYSTYPEYPDPPGYRLWLYFQQNNGYNMSFIHRLKWSIKDIKTVLRNRKNWLYKTLSRFFERHILWRFS